MKFQLAAFTSLITLLPVATAAPVEQRDTTYRLPQFMQLFANNGTNDIGCINGFGNFTVTGSCSLFHVTYTSGNNGNDGIISGNNPCDLGSGPLDGAHLDCTSGANGNLGQFWNRDGFMSVDGPTGIAYSINQLPDPNNVNQYGIEYGTPLIIGGSGRWGQFKLRVHAAQG